MLTTFDYTIASTANGAYRNAMLEFYKALFQGAKPQLFAKKSDYSHPTVISIEYCYYLSWGYVLMPLSLVKVPTKLLDGLEIGFLVGNNEIVCRLTEPTIG